MSIAYPEPVFLQEPSIYVSEPAVPTAASSAVINAMKHSNLSSKASPNMLFEENLKKYFQMPTACSVSNGYTGLFVILKALKLFPSQKNEIILPDATMIAVLNAVIDNKFEPVLVDNEPDHLNPSACSFIKKVTPKTKAIIVTHTFGVPVVNFQDLVEFCQKNEIYLIEDIAESLGVKYKGKLLGTFGHFSSASLYANKLITCGDGGFILSKLSRFHDQDLNQLWKCIINHGFSKGYHFNHTIQTGNYRINGLGAAFISNFPSYIEDFIFKRKLIDKIYRQHLCYSQFYQLMEDNSGGENTPWVFALRVKDHQSLVAIRQFLASQGIETRPFFKPIHTQPIISSSQAFPNSQIQYSTGFYLPTYQELSEQMQVYIASSINSFFKIEPQPAFMEFKVKPRRLLDMLCPIQIEEMIDNLIEEVQHPVSGKQILKTKIKQKLKLLGQKIRCSEILQIALKQKLENQAKSITIIKQSKQITLKKEKDCKNFGKICQFFDASILQYLPLFTEHLQLETRDGTYIIWQRQENKANCIEEMTDFIILRNQETLAYSIAKAITSFHKISEHISNKILQNKVKNCLSNNLKTIKDQFDLNFSRLNTSIHLNALLQSVINSLIEKEKNLKITDLRIIHNHLTSQKIVLLDPQRIEEQQHIKIYDFEHLSVNQFIIDLAVYQQKFSLIKLNELVIEQYLKLNQMEGEAENIKSRIKITKMARLLRAILEQASSSTFETLKFRDFCRKKVTQIVELYRCWMSPTQKQHFFSFLKQNFAQVKLNQTIKKKFKTNLKMGWNHHYGGWKYVQNLITQNFDSKFGKVLFISALEKSFYDLHISEPIEQKWCAFIHNVPLSMENLCTNLETLFNTSNFINSLKNCQGIFCLTDEIKQRFCQEFPNVPCQKLYYPLTPPNSYFDPSKVLSQNKIITLLHVGEYLRDLQFFKNAKVSPMYRKCIVECEGITKENYIQKELSGEQGGKQKNDNMVWLQRLEDEEYEQLLSTSIVFIYLKGAGGCTTVLECISRNIPILVNRLSALEEYLGKDYPMFYESRQHAQAIITNNFRQKIWQTYFYLLSLNKQQFYPQSFIYSFYNSYIYQMIPVPNQEKEDFQSYDLSILMISYNREFNIRTIVDKLSSQTFKGTVELIIWNNNPRYSLQFVNQDFSHRFANLVVIESSFNYYCFVRSAVASLARGKFLLFCDDDVFPKENFLKSFYDNFLRLEKEHSAYELVITLKGNVFHTQHPAFDINFWVNFDNIHHIDQSDDEQQIDVIHMDTCMMKRSLMLKCASYQIPELDYILVDDYWYSYVLSKFLNSKIIKIKLSEPVFDQCPSSEDSDIALYKQTKTLRQKNRFFAYHHQRNWPATLSKEDNHLQPRYQSTGWNEEAQVTEAQPKSKERCLQIYQNTFSGFNVGSGLWLNCLNHLSLDCKCEVVRIGVVDKQKEFLCFYQKNGVQICPPQQIVNKLKKVNQIYSSKKINYIITLANIPGNNDYCNKIKAESWQSNLCLEQLELLWEIIASYFVSKPYCIGYDLINEPILQNSEDSHELLDIYKRIIQRIRKVDAVTPIILEPLAGHYSNLRKLVEAVQQDKIDDNLIYSYHFYDPYVWTSARQRKNEQVYRYPGPIPQSAGVNSNWSVNTEIWDKDKLESIFRQIQSVRNEWKLKDYQILMSEYGCRIDRKGIEDYFTDIHILSKQYNISRLAYAYREQWWPKMNYENHGKAFNIIREDIAATKKNVSFKLLVNNLLILKSPETQWLDYNPFYFEIRQNQLKKKLSRVPILLDIQPSGSLSELQPIFIVGCGRSGTTFLLKCLSFNQQFLCLHEPLQLWLQVFPEFNIWSKEDYQILHADGLFYERSKVRCQKIKQFYHYILKKSSKKITIVDKQPENVFKLNFLRMIFPKMKVIYIQRNVQKVGASISNFTLDEWYGREEVKFRILVEESEDRKLLANKQFGRMSEMGEIEWKESVKAWKQYKLSRSMTELESSVFQIQFEELIKSTFSVLKKLCQFLKCDQTSTRNICVGGEKIAIKK